MVTPLIILSTSVMRCFYRCFYNKNNRYAFEGIISAFKIAEIRGHEDALLDLGYTIDEGLYKLGGYVIRLFTFLQCSVAGRCIFLSHRSLIHLSFDWFTTLIVWIFFLTHFDLLHMLLLILSFPSY